MRQIFFRRNFHVRIYRNHKNNKQLKAKKKTKNEQHCVMYEAKSVVLIMRGSFAKVKASIYSK